MQEISSSSFSPHLDEQSYLICDTKGIIRYASRGFQDLYGYDSSECIGQTYNNLVGCGSLLGTEAGNALKEEAAKAGLQFSEAISAVQTMMSDMDEAAQKIFKAPLGTVIPMAAGPCLMANRRRNCELFVCEVVLKRSLHPTLGWSYNVTIQRDVSAFISVPELLKASSRGMLHFNTFCRNVGPPSSGDEPLTDDHLNAVAQHMWTSNLIMDMSKKKDGKKSTSTKAPSLASVSTTCSSRKSTSSIQSAASSASHSPMFHHLGAIIGLAQTKQSEVMEKVAEEVEVAPEESPVPRFWDILEGPDEERVEEADTWDAFGPEESPVKWEMPFVDFKELVEHVSREALCELSLPLVIADPSKAHFPIILCSTGERCRANACAALKLQEGSNEDQNLSEYTTCSSPWPSSTDAIVDMTKLYLPDGSLGGKKRLDGSCCLKCISPQSTTVTTTPPTSTESCPVLSSGARQVFGYEDEECGGMPMQDQTRRKEGNWASRQLKLWWVLEIAFPTVTASLSIVVSAIWHSTNSRGAVELQNSTTHLLNNYRTSCMDSLNELTNEVQRQISDATSIAVQHFLHVPELAVGVSEDLLHLDGRLMSTVDLTQNMQVFWTQIRHRFPELQSAFYADSEGRYLGYTRKGDDLVLEYRPSDIVNTSSTSCTTLCPDAKVLLPGLTGTYSIDESGTPIAATSAFKFDPRDASWFKQSQLNSGRRIWTQPFPLFEDGAAIAVVKGTETPGGFMLVGSAISLATLSKSLAKIQSKNLKNMFLVDLSSGGLIASSADPADVTMHLKHGEQKQLQWNEASNPLVLESVRQILESHGSFEKESGNDAVSITHDQKGEYNFAHQIISEPSKTGLNWTAVYVQQLKEFQQSINNTSVRIDSDRNVIELRTKEALAMQTTWTLMMSAGFTLLGAVAMGCVSRAITQPLKQISADMRSVAKLEFLNGEWDGTASLRENDALSWRSHRRNLSSDSPFGESRIEEVAQMREAFSCMESGLRSFSRYMDPSVVQALLQSKRQAQLGVAKAEVTIFFSDIAGFTTMAERLPPQTFMDVLSLYLDEMSAVIMKRQGIVGEFIGDAIMAWWNAPMEIGKYHTVFALDAAVAQQRRLAELCAEWREQGLPDVYARMGISRGTVYAGNIGSSLRMKYGLVGDTVNLTSRLEGLCKKYCVNIIIDRAARDAPGVEEGFFCRPLDLVVVKGRTSCTEIFELVARKPQLAFQAFNFEECQAFVDSFSSIQIKYRHRDFQGALRCLDIFQARWPGDRPAEILRERCEALLAKPPSEDWTPVESLSHK